MLRLIRDVALEGPLANPEVVVEACRGPAVIRRRDQKRNGRSCAAAGLDSPMTEMSAPTIGNRICLRVSERPSSYLESPAEEFEIAG